MPYIRVFNQTGSVIQVSVTSNTNPDGSMLYFAVDPGSHQAWERSGMETIFVYDGNDDATVQVYIGQVGATTNVY
jgi:hypothetical protein